MQQRIDYQSVDPKGYQLLGRLHQHVQSSGLEPPMMELVKIRASQINGCAYCVDLHARDAAEAGETLQRLHGIAVWREAPFYTDRERAALDWTEAVTLIAVDHVPDEVFERVRGVFTDEELTSLTLAIVTINSFNRLAVAFRKAVPVDENKEDS